MKMKLIFKRESCKVFLLLVGIFLFSNLSAQDASRIKIKGTVIDNMQKETIIGASVAIKGTTNGTITDTDGRFQLEAPSNATLLISFIGFKSKEVAVNGKSELSITLDEDAELLDEIVVIGYGQIRKGDATGSILSFKPDEKNKGIQLKAEDALVGKMAGVNVVPGNGAPGEGGKIRIRMGASLSASNDPLIVIDGIPVDNISISSINPNDIASFTVLKDASATAIYGSRASNGVIIITTKKGDTTGYGKPHINYSSNYAISTLPSYYDVLSTDEFRTTFAQHANAPANFQLGDASTNWQKQIYRTAFGTEHNVSITGAIPSMPYRVSVGYANQDGILKENNYQRANLGFGIAPKFFDKHLSLDINAKGSIERNKPVPTGVIGSAIGFDPTRDIHQSYPNNVGLGYYTWMDEGTPIVLAAANPLAELKLGDRLTKTNRLIGNMAVNYKVHGLEDLNLNMNIGYDIMKIDKNESTPQNAPTMYTSGLQDGTATDFNSIDKKRNYLIDLYANYSKDLNELHNINLMGGYGWQRFWNRYNEKTTYIGSTKTKSPKHTDEELYLLSFFGRANYSFAQKLMLTASLRADASSRFSSKNRWGYFPSVALAYRLSEENFIKEIKAISDLKLRLSYGQTGQQDIGSYYQHLATYNSSYEDSQYLFGEEWLTTFRPNGYDPNIKWETTSTYNFGLDYGFINNRVYGSLDVYTRTTRNLLNNIFVPAGSNFANRIDTNIGDMKSKGIEVAISAVPVKTKDWEWTVSGNFTWSSAEITKLNTIDTAANYVKTGDAGGGTNRQLQVHQVGETPNTFFLLKQAYDDNGKPLDGKYVAKDGSITTSEADANKYMTEKSSQIPYYYGLSTSLKYKNWDFGMNGHGAFGNYVYNFQEANQSFSNLFSANKVSSNISKTALRNGFTQERLFTDHYLERGAFFKMDNITLGYSFDKLWKTSSSLRLAFSAQNVFIISDYSGMDPEIYTGIDRNVYQRPRIYTLSLNLNF